LLSTCPTETTIAASLTLCYTNVSEIHRTVLVVLEKLGPFKIGRVLGRGGMGAVYEGIHATDNSVVAIKVQPDPLDEDREVRVRFETEIETLKRLHHPNIVRLSGFGAEQGQLYYVMECVEGPSLQQELRKKRLFQWYEAAKIGLEICQALRHAHDRGVIHRDIKPANILLDQEGNVKLSDFGIARFFGAQQITDMHSVVGTLEYMSPEQALANPINSSTDLYSLGCVLYALLTGKPPFPARSLPELLRKHKTASPTPIRSVRDDVPDELGYIIMDLLQIRAEDRPRNAFLVMKRLQSLVQALIGDPAEIKVLPTPPEILKQQDHDPVSPRLPVAEHDSGSVIDLGKITNIETDAASDRAVPLPQTDTVTSLSSHRSDDVPHDEFLLSNGPTQHFTKGKPTTSSVTASPLPDTPVRFTAVTTKNLDPFEEENHTSRPIFSLPMVLTSTMLLLIGLTVYYLIKPLPPDVWYARITAAIREIELADGSSLAQLISAQKDIRDFLSKYDDHPLAEQVRTYQDKLELSEHERRLERRMQFSALRSLSPVERTYVNILTSSPSDPEQMIDKLRAFIAVFQTARSPVESAKPHRLTSSPVEICVELARRRLKKLEQDVDEINADQQQVIRRRLDEAADRDASDPVRAEEIRRGIIELYQNYRWAKELVEEARQLLSPTTTTTSQ